MELTKEDDINCAFLGCKTVVDDDDFATGANAMCAMSIPLTVIYRLASMTLIIIGHITMMTILNE